jgi:nucleoside-diphosphate-sugar epimerase
MRKILITEAVGFSGNHLVKQLIVNGEMVIGLENVNGN